MLLEEGGIRNYAGKSIKNEAYEYVTNFYENEVSALVISITGEKTLLSLELKLNMWTLKINFRYISFFFKVIQDTVVGNFILIIDYEDSK